jgi:hypothetical protein
MSDSRPPPPATILTSQAGSFRLAWSVLALALISGGILRARSIDDMEWKNDERWSYRMSQEVGRSRPWPSLGMPTSLGFPNPGLSVWIFVPIGRLAHTPTSMARVIAFLNTIGLLGFAWAVRAYLPRGEREPWLWGLALQAVSPFAIRLSRKIWPPSLLTPFLLLLWVTHRHRQARWGAFAWGLVGALIGQVHLSGWFVALGLVLGTAFAEWRHRLPRSRYWHWWLLGNLLGFATALPWAYTLSTSSVSLPAQTGRDILTRHLPATLYWLAATATSVRPFACLGLGHATPDYLAGPIIDGIPTHVPELLCWFTVVAIVLRIVVRLLRAIVALVVRWTWRTGGPRAGNCVDRDPSAITVPAKPGTECASTQFYLWSTIAIPSTIFMLTTSVYFHHYYYALCPFLFVLVALCMLPWRRALLGLVIAQALMSYVYLSYIHENGGISRGDYGVSYARQVNR